MIRLGGHSSGNLPPHDPALERRLANWAVVGNAAIFAAAVAAIHLAPYVLEPMGFEVLV